MNIQKKIYGLFILLLPFCSLGYFINIFQGLAMNASMYPLILGVVLMIFQIIYSRRIYFKNNNSVKIFNILCLFVIVVIVDTIVMNYVLSTYIIEYKEQSPLTHSIPKLISIILIPIIIYYVMHLVRNKKDVYNTIKLIYVAMFIVILYGYIQLFAYYFPNSIFNNIYIGISNAIDFGWMNSKSWNYVLISSGRLNLTTPEPSEAAHLFNVVLYPFLLSSVINRFTLYKNKILGMSYEAAILILSLPILVFMLSSAGYIICTLQFLIALTIFLKNQKNTILKSIVTILLICIILFFIYIILPYDIKTKIIYFSTKINDKSNGSTNTRFGGSVASLRVFLKYPIGGTGWNNVGFLLKEYIPNWAIFNTELTNTVGIGSKTWPSGGAQWINLISSVGILGTLIFVYFIYYIWKFIKTYKNKSHFLNFIFIAFIEFFIGFLLQGFNSPSFNFIYQWAVLGFFIAVINVNNYNILKNSSKMVQASKKEKK